MKAFVKFCAVVAVIALIILEAGSPLWTRPEVAGAADDSASAGAQDYFASAGNKVTAQAAAVAAAKFRGTTLTAFDVLPDGQVKVSVYRHASPHALDHFSQFKNWYNVKSSATAAAHS